MKVKNITQQCKSELCPCMTGPTTLSEKKNTHDSITTITVKKTPISPNLLIYSLAFKRLVVKYVKSFSGVAVTIL